MSLRENEMKYNLERFKIAQERSYAYALAEIRNGRKVSHWMWYVFPQIAGLGRSSTAEYYSISCLDEAREYLADEVLGERLIEISSALLELNTNDAETVMGFPDCLKLRSSMTLFSVASGGKKVFNDVIAKYYGGEPDERTLEIIKAPS